MGTLITDYSQDIISNGTTKTFPSVDGSGYSSGFDIKQ